MTSVLGYCRLYLLLLFSSVLSFWNSYYPHSRFPGFFLIFLITFFLTSLLFYRIFRETLLKFSPKVLIQLDTFNFHEVLLWPPINFFFFPSKFVCFVKNFFSSLWDWAKSHVWVYLQGSLWWGSHLSRWTEESRWPSPRYVGIIRSVEGLNREEREGGGIPPPAATWAKTSVFSSLRPGLGFTPWAPLSLKSLDLDWDQAFPSLHFWFCFSGEPRLITGSNHLFFQTFS